ncbi:MAG TPA: sulfatase-like hydrolase/transferase [Chitinophagaceae bacterium]
MSRNILFSFVAVLSQTLWAQDNRPNIIYIMADDLGYADLSCYGRKDYRTPNLDKLCSQGVKFLNAYSTAPVCTPTRVAFMTGRYPARTTVGLFEPLTNTPKDTMIGLLPEVPSIPALLKKANYESFLVGKWHLGYPSIYSPIRNGFDYFYGFNAGAIDYVAYDNELYENEKIIHREGYLTDVWTEKAIEIINQPHSKPYFLCIMFNAPHWPWQAPGDKPYGKRGANAWSAGGSAATYAAMMKSLDSAVGKIVNAVDNAKLSANTVIIFTSDNGGERYSDNGPYKQGKMSLWEGGIREPAFVRWTGKIKPHSITHQVTTTFDWTATILSLAGAKADPSFPLDGINIMPVLLGKTKEIDRTLYWRIFQRKDNKAMREGKWKWLRDEKQNEYLFDIVSDPLEKNDLKDKYPAIVLRLKNKFIQWEKTVLPPLPL